MKKLLIVLFVLSFGAISFAQVGQAEDLTADSSSIDVSTDTDDTNDTGDYPTDEAGEEPIDYPTDEPVEEPTEEPTEEPNEEPT